MIVKIDQNGDVIKSVVIPPIQPIPENCRTVDLIKYIPKDLKWYEAYDNDTIVREDDKYFMKYKIVEAAPKNSFKRRELFLSEFTKLRALNKKVFMEQQISKEQFDSNNLLLDMTNPDDEETYNLLEKLEFNMLAKIDSNGEVIEFPFVKPPTMGNEIPEDIVKVDTNHFKPTNLKWYQAAWYDTVVKVDDKYCATYTIGEKKFSSPEEKKDVFKYFIEYFKNINQISFANQQITEEKYNSNLNILNNIDVNDETHYDEFDKLEF